MIPREHAAVEVPVHAGVAVGAHRAEERVLGRARSTVADLDGGPPAAGIVTSATLST